MDTLFPVFMIRFQSLVVANEYIFVFVKSVGVLKLSATAEVMYKLKGRCKKAHPYSYVRLTNPWYATSKTSTCLHLFVYSEGYPTP